MMRLHQLRLLKMTTPTVKRGCAASTAAAKIVRQQRHFRPPAAAAATFCGSNISNYYSTTRTVAASTSTTTAFSSTMIPPTEMLPPVLPLPSSRQQHQHQQLAPSKPFWHKLWDRYSLKGQQHRIHMAESLFQAATRQASDPRWFGPGRISRDFRPRHALLTMHLWFLHKRLISDTSNDDNKQLALLIQEELFNILWIDTTCRIRQQGVGEMLVNKNLMQVQQYTFLHLTHYDHAYTDYFLTRPAERLKELRKIASHHILLHRGDTVPSSDLCHDDQLDRIAWYIEAQYQNILLDWPDEYYRQARVAWIDLPDFSGMRSSSSSSTAQQGQGHIILPPNAVHPDDVLPEPWLRNITNRGVEYYWNPDTMKSSWERPTTTTTAAAAATTTTTTTTSGGGAGTESSTS